MTGHAVENVEIPARLRSVCVSYVFHMFCMYCFLWSSCLEDPFSLLETPAQTPGRVSAGPISGAPAADGDAPCPSRGPRHPALPPAPQPGTHAPRSHPASVLQPRRFSWCRHRQCWLLLFALSGVFSSLRFLFSLPSFPLGFPGGSVVKNLPASTGNGFDPWVKKSPWRREWQPTPVFMPGEFHVQRSLVGYSPSGRRESDQ